MSDLTLSGRRLASRRVALRKQRDGQRVAGNMAGAFDFAGDGRGELLLDDFEIVFGQRRGKFIVREQLHAAFKLVGQNLQRKIHARRFVRADVVQRLLKREPVERFCAVGEKFVQRLVHAVLACGHLDLRVVFDAAINADGVADGFRLHDELDSVGQIRDERIQRRGGDGQLLRDFFCPGRQG